MVSSRFQRDPLSVLSQYTFSQCRFSHAGKILVLPDLRDLETPTQDLLELGTFPVGSEESTLVTVSGQTAPST